MKPTNNCLHITVMRGGPGSERDVSLRSGDSVVAALRSLGHDVTEIDPQTRQFSLPEKTDVVFLALHGAYGEDGTIQSQLEEKGIPYTGCGVRTSQAAFDKVQTKLRCIEAGVPTPRFEVFRSPGADWPAGWKTPAVLKPVCQGSSVGLYFITEVEDWPGALTACLRHDTQAILEEQIIGRECTVGILDGQALPIVEVRPRSGVYDYQSKYTIGASEYLCPAPFSPKATRSIQWAGLQAFEAVGSGPYARVDVMVDADENPYVLEVNTLPGMTETSLLPKAAEAGGIGYVELCERMVRLALKKTLPPARQLDLGMVMG